MSEIKKILGDNIRLLRNQKGWTQVYIADSLQITAPFLAQIESGKKGASLELIEKIAAFFSVPVYYLFLDKCIENKDFSIGREELSIYEKNLQASIKENIENTFLSIKRTCVR